MKGVDESPINPKYYEKMSELLDALIKERKAQALDYKAYLEKIIELAKTIKDPPRGTSYPKSLDSSAKRALYDNLEKEEALALDVDEAVRSNKQDDWQHNIFKTKKIRFAIKDVLGDEERTDAVLELVKNQQEYN